MHLFCECAWSGTSRVFSHANSNSNELCQESNCEFDACGIRVVSQKRNGRLKIATVRCPEYQNGTRKSKKKRNLRFRCRRSFFNTTKAQRQASRTGWWEKKWVLEKLRLLLIPLGCCEVWNCFYPRRKNKPAHQPFKAACKYLGEENNIRPFARTARPLKQG